jgi:hypothetical protein
MLSSAVLEAPLGSSRHRSAEPEIHDSDALSNLVVRKLSTPEGTTKARDEDQPHASHASVINTQANVRHESFRVLNRWEGLVEDVDLVHDEFSARIQDLTNPKVAEETATFSLDDVSDSDRHLVTVGAIFYWFIGYHTSKHGQTTRQSLIRFRRLPTVTRGNTRRTQRRANELSEIFGPHD